MLTIPRNEGGASTSSTSSSSQSAITNNELGPAPASSTFFLDENPAIQRFMTDSGPAIFISDSDTDLSFVPEYSSVSPSYTTAGSIAADSAFADTNRSRQNLLSLSEAPTLVPSEKGSLDTGDSPENSIASDDPDHRPDGNQSYEFPHEYPLDQFDISLFFNAEREQTPDTADLSPSLAERFNREIDAHFAALAPIMQPLAGLNL
jgi:hypothetical protein